jgi:hypothetical protein
VSPTTLCLIEALRRRFSNLIGTGYFTRQASRRPRLDCLGA